MTFIFPENKEDFTAANGITYTWAENRWRTKTFDSNEYLPLSGGSVTGNLTVTGAISNQGGMLIAGPTDKALRVYDINGGAVFDAHCEKFGFGVQYFGAVETKYHVTTKDYVDAKFDSIESELSTKEKMYLQGFYPFTITNSGQPEAGQITFKTYNYLHTLNPDEWKEIEYSVVDAYGQDLAGKFMNHMDTREVETSKRIGQVWFAREDGRKLISFYGPISLKDNNFESRMSMTLENEKKQVISPNYDTATKRVDNGETLWVKCSFWGN